MLKLIQGLLYTLHVEMTTSYANVLSCLMLGNVCSVLAIIDALDYYHHYSGCVWPCGQWSVCFSLPYLFPGGSAITLNKPFRTLAISHVRLGFYCLSQVDSCCSKISLCYYSEESPPIVDKGSLYSEFILIPVIIRIEGWMILI